LICVSLGVSLSYCFETEGSVLESTSLWCRVSGILNVGVVEKALVKELMYGIRLEVRKQCVGKALEARTVRTSTRGADMAQWRST
jgi:hypothetical protein